METNRLVHFKTLVEIGNMRKAAELLHVSHGGLSKSIAKLESELGAKLIRPEGRGIAITEQGKQVYAKARELLGAADSFLSDVKGLGSEVTDVVRIGTFEVFSTYFIGALLEKKTLGGSLRMREYVPGKLEEAIHGGEVDIGITYVPIPRAELSFSKACRIRMGIFSAASAFPRVATENLPFVVPVSPVEGSPTGVKGLDGWPDHLFARRIGFEVELMETALALCRQGNAAAFLPRFIAELHNKLVLPGYRLAERPMPRGLSAVSRDVYLITRKGEEDTRVVRQLASGLRLLT